MVLSSLKWLVFPVKVRHIFFVSCRSVVCVLFITTVLILPSYVPFQFSRLPFPLRLEFTVSINKAQRQFLKDAGAEI